LHAFFSSTILVTVRIGGAMFNGQNLFALSGRPTLNITQAVDMWFNEVLQFTNIPADIQRYR
jgi:hypothetical protein